MIKNIFPTAALIIIAITSCNTDPVKFGIDIMPTTDNFSVTFDTSLQKTAKTLLNDSLITHSYTFDGYYYTNYDSCQLLGDYQDDLFGNKTCELLYEVLPNDTVPAFRTDSVSSDVKPDSLILYLKVDSVLLGNRNESQEYEIYELAKNLSFYSTYYSSANYTSYKGSLIGTGTFSPNSYYIRIPINDNGTEIMSRLYNLNKINNNDTAFNRFFKGFYILPKKSLNSKGAIINIHTQVNTSKLSLYCSRWTKYKKGTTLDGISLKSDTMVLIHKIKNYSARSTNGSTSIKNDYTNSQITSNADHFFIQGAAGPYAQINLLNTYNTWKDSGYVAFNRVLLELTPDHNFLAGYGITSKHYPNSLQIYYNDSTVETSITHGKDTVYAQKSYFISFYDKLDGVYRFNITPIFQKIVKEKPTNTAYINKWNNLDLYIKDIQGGSIKGGLRSGGRIAFHKNSGIKLKVIYSIIK